MGIVLNFGVGIRKSMRTCYRSACNHPFLVAMLLFLVFLHRSFPAVFSLLVTAFPVFACSAALLGTLLIFGQPNTPEIVKEYKSSQDIASHKARVSRDDIVVSERGRSFSTERRSGNAKETAEISEVDDFDGSVGYVQLIDETLQHNHNEKRGTTEGMERELDRTELESKSKIGKEKVRYEGMTRDVEAIEEQLQKVRDEILQGRDDISHRDSSDPHKSDISESGGRGGGDDADDDEASDNESDGAESSSPDASMADILQILDELHPLLDLEAPQPANTSPDKSDDDSSDKSNDGSNEYDEDARSHDREGEEDGVDDNEVDEDEAQGGKEDDSRSAIKWTEDDQKNVMDLGKSELERNQWLETLIARRRATKSFKLAAEKNLIDLDKPDNPFNVTPISTTRSNPFDPSNDSSYDSMGLPPIPGSAPSILLPGRNPFHLPYVSNHEKPDLKGDHFQQRFMTSHPREIFFSRHESFSLGTSSLGDPRQERQDFKWRPIFVAEQLAPEGTSYSSLQKQSSDASDTKLSSAPETESVSSTIDLEERKFSEQDLTKEAEVISNIYHSYELVGQESQSSEDVDMLEMERARKNDVQHDELEIKLGNVEDMEPCLSSTGRLASHVEITNEVHVKPEPFKEDSSTGSSLSSLSELDEKTSASQKGGPTSLEPTGDLDVMISILPEPPLEESEVLFTSRMVDENLLKEPIYDSSPTASEKLVLFDSISTERRADISEIMYYSEADVDLPKNLGLKKAASSDAGDEYVSFKDKSPSEPEKDLFLSDEFNTEPRFDDHNALHEPAIILSESKDDSSIIQDVNALEAREVQVSSNSTVSTVQEPITTHPVVKQVSFSEKANVGELAKSLGSQDVSTKVGTNAMGFTKVVASSNVGSGVQETSNPDIVLKQVPEDNVGDLQEPSNSKDGSDSLGVSEAGSTQEIASRNTRSNDNETITHAASKQISEGNIGDIPKPADHRLTNVGTNAVSSTLDLASSNSRSGVQDTIIFGMALKQVPEVNVGELPKPSNSKEESTDLGTNAVESTKDVASSNAGSQETITTNKALKQVTEGDFGQLPEPSSSKYGSEKLETNAVASPREIASTDTGYTVHETVTTHTASTQVCEASVGELPKSSDSKDGSNAVGSTKEIASNDARSGIQDITTTQMALKEAPEGNGNELRIVSNSKDESKIVGTNTLDSTKGTESSHTQSEVQESTTTNGALRHDSDGNVGEMPKPSDLEDDLTKARTNVLGFTEDIALSNKPLTTHTTSDQVSQGNVGELPRAPSSKDGSRRQETNAMDSTNEIATSNTESSIPENAPTLTGLQQVSEVNVGELPKPSDSKNGSTKAGTNAVSSTMEAASSNVGSGVQKSITAGPALMQDFDGNVSEIPKQPLKFK